MNGHPNDDASDVSVANGYSEREVNEAANSEISNPTNSERSGGSDGNTVLGSVMDGIAGVFGTIFGGGTSK